MKETGDAALAERQQRGVQLIQLIKGTALPGSLAATAILLSHGVRLASWFPRVVSQGPLFTGPQKKFSVSTDSRAHLNRADRKDRAKAAQV